LLTFLAPQGLASTIKQVYACAKPEAILIAEVSGLTGTAFRTGRPQGRTAIDSRIWPSRPADGGGAQ
jgi:hypothetical protein